MNFLAAKTILRLGLLSMLAYTGYAQTESVAPASAVLQPSSAVAPSTVEPGEPLPDTPETTVDPASLLPQLPGLSSRKVSLIGGTVEKLDRVRDQLTLRIFGGGKMKIDFDPRTHVYRDGAETPISDLHRGDRLSIDTVLDNGIVVARNIRLETAAAGESQGTVVSYNGANGELIVRDALSPHLLKLHATSQTRFLDRDRPASASQLIRGTLVTVKFGSQKDGNAIAQEVSVLAIPGSTVTFVGHVTALDLRANLLVVTSAADGKNYEIYLDPSTITLDDNLRLTADVTVLTRFDGDRYVAQNVTVN
ncbi:MAG: DUF5666 domain-containing protein [Terriglobales bacterium]